MSKLQHVGNWAELVLIPDYGYYRTSFPSGALIAMFLALLILGGRTGLAGWFLSGPVYQCLLSPFRNFSLLINPWAFSLFS